MVAEVQGIELIVDGRLQFGAAQIALYESCPRRFFYTHVLQVGGRRTATAFMHLHEAVRVVVEAMRWTSCPRARSSRATVSTYCCTPSGASSPSSSTSPIVRDVVSGVGVGTRPG